MHLVSVNVGTVSELRWEGHLHRTAFLKRPVAGKVAMRGVNLEGDDQGDREVHGGPRKSVYVYPSEHYPYWRIMLARPDLGWGSFGENLTVSGWLEESARIGDRIRIGTVILEVTQPRRPCVKMNAAFKRNDMIERFREAGRSGFYLGGVRDGEMGAGDPIEKLSGTPGAPSIADIVGRERSGPTGA